MKNVCDELRESIDRLAACELESLSAEAVARAEAHLNECAACADRMSAMAAEPEGVEATAVAGPTSETWERVWKGIEAASSGAAVQRAGNLQAWKRHRTLYRIWSGMAAAAVLMISVGIWQLARSVHEGAGVLDLARSGDVRFGGMQVFGSATSFVLAAGEDENIPVIWVVEDEGA